MYDEIFMTQYIVICTLHLVRHETVLVVFKPPFPGVLIDRASSKRQRHNSEVIPRQPKLRFLPSTQWSQIPPQLSPSVVIG